MEIDWPLVAKIAAPVLTLVIGIWLNQQFENRPKLIAYISDVANFTIRRTAAQGGDLQIYTHSVVVRNAGRRPAHDVRLRHFVLPDHYKIYPPMEHDVVDIPDSDQKEILIPLLIARAQITVSYLYDYPLRTDQISADVTCDEGIAQIISTIPVRVYPVWFNRLIQAMIFAGSITILYLIFIATGWIIRTAF